MSVLIKGMEMPERVQLLELHSDGKVYTRKGYLIGEAVELPDKHGRLIDADALKADYGMKDDCADCDKELRGKSKACEFDRVYTKMDFCGWLDDAKTVDAVEVIRCKDCRWWRDSDHTCKEHSLVSPMMAEEFCSRAERREVSE